MLSAMTLDQLRVLVTVAESGSFSAAARKLKRVQSAISQSVQSLESGLGVQLFDRSQKTPALTEIGAALLVQARQVLLEAAALKAQAIAFTGGMEPDLTLAIDNLFPSAPLIASLKALRLQFPDLPVTLYTAPIFAAERRLREGSADIAICGVRPDEAADLVVRPLILIEMTPVAAPDHPLAQAHAPLSREMMGRHVQLILTDPSAPPEGPNFGVIGSRVWRFVDLGRRLDFLRAGLGWCNMPDHLVAPLIQSGDLVRLRLAEPSLLPQRIPFSAIHLRDRPPGAAGRWLLDHLLEVYGNGPGVAAG